MSERLSCLSCSVNEVEVACARDKEHAHVQSIDDMIADLPAHPIPSHPSQGPHLSKDLGFTSIEQGIARVLNFVEEQQQHNTVWRTQLQRLVTEQAGLRAMLELHHKQVLQRLPGASVPYISPTAARNDNAFMTEVNDKDQNTPVTLSSVLEDSHQVNALMTQAKDNNDYALVPQRSFSVDIYKGKDDGRADVKVGEISCRALAKAATAANMPKSKTFSAGQIRLLDLADLPRTWREREFAKKTISKKLVSMSKKIEAFVKSVQFDAVFTIIIILNLFSSCVQLQWKGYSTALLLGIREDDNGWNEAKHILAWLEFSFATTFAVELLLRIYFLGCAWLSNVSHAFDTLIVVMTCVQCYILQPAGFLTRNPSFIGVGRLVRLVRVLRFFEVVQFAAACAELRILSRALSGCLGSLVWSIFLLATLIMAGSIIICQTVTAYVENVTNPLETRKWAYETFGTISLSVLALWESTFTGSWHRFSRVMILEMHWAYAFFWVPYIVCINFSVMRLIGALFLKETMSVAAVDKEKTLLSRMNKRRVFADKITQVFKEADTSGDGKISPDEFQSMLTNEHVGTCFEKLNLDVAEVVLLFELLAAEDGFAYYDEFVEGALKLKETAQTIDIIQLIHGNLKLSRGLQTIYSELVYFANSSGVDMARKKLDLDTVNSGYLFTHTGIVKQSAKEDTFGDLSQGGPPSKAGTESACIDADND